MRIGVDLMGSEKKPRDYLAAIFQLSEQLPDNHRIVVIATKEIADFLPARVDFHVVSDVITMEDDPLKVARRKKDSSLVVGVHLLASGSIDGFVSAGNTGALIAACRLYLPLLPGFKRPALLATLPRKGGSFALLDVGGHISFKPEHLVQFAKLGAAFVKAAKGKKSPVVGLLNIGEETEKGTKEMRLAHRLLRENLSSFVGNIEGRDVFQSELDVLVTDGFTGNVFLKTAEGLSSYLIHEFQSSFEDADLSFFKEQYCYENYPGAIVSGIEGLVMKCHGASPPQGIVKSIKEVFNMASLDLVKKMKEELK